MKLFQNQFEYGSQRSVCNNIYYFYPFMFEEYEVQKVLIVCLFVCLSVCPDFLAYISETTGPIFLKFGTRTGS